MDLYLYNCLLDWRVGMIKQKMSHDQSGAKYTSYIIGFILSIITTVLAYVLVVNNVLPKETLIYAVMGIAVVQLAIQLIFFLHLGHGGRWKVVTFIFALLIVLIVVIGSIWIMHNLDYNMMQMTPEQMNEYMKANEGI
jgi:cytochrome o ubiquinol oxidase operon protein cyoD